MSGNCLDAGKKVTFVKNQRLSFGAEGQLLIFEKQGFFRLFPALTNVKLAQGCDSIGLKIDGGDVGGAFLVLGGVGGNVLGDN